MQARQSTEDRQAAIVQAVLQLCRDTSPAHVTTGAIAAALGLTQGALFKHFANKDAIWQAVMQWVHAELLRRLEAAAGATADPLAALAAVFQAHVAFVVAQPGVPRFIFHELQQGSDSAAKQEVRLLLQAYRHLLLQLMVAAVQQGRLPPDLDHQAAATLFVGIVQGLGMQSMLSGKPAAMRAQAGPVFAIYLRGLGGLA